ncbi:hypothetical protein JVT61DRAFT_2626 [Boletus reticuloceps]|uniref:Uncharacterized protein n=1 Tax=Boletus reticuloceps TaxID=495285 RepID=A0A8I2YPK5_9AGAM|nr:hypothetical protein JVT61DRAFT_2626 [Boletus reticuloceps]
MAIFKITDQLAKSTATEEHFLETVWQPIESNKLSNVAGNSLVSQLLCFILNATKFPRCLQIALFLPRCHLPVCPRCRCIQYLLHHDIE